MEGLTMEWNPIAPRLLPRREEKFHSGGSKIGEKRNKKKRTKKINTTNYTLSLNSQRANNLELEDDQQLRLDLERELRAINRDKEYGNKYGTKGSRGEVVKGVSKSWGRSGGRKHREMEEDPKFAMEMEVVRTKKLREEIDGRENRKDKRKLHKKYGRTSSQRVIVAPLSEARMVSRGDRMIEQRVSMIGGHKVTVDLANPALHGADLMMNPGAIIHGLLESNPKTNER
ncbi:hypothetical protein PENTCL1PPCAC_22605, partial [Pristionchus entomophagus]